MLMTVDHAGGQFDGAHLHGDTAARWVVGSALPAGEFLTRWVTHLCAPTFVLLAGASLALSADKRRGEPGQTRFIVTRGVLIAALDPLWMALAFASYVWLPLQVLYAIGLSMVCMAGLRKLPTRWLLAAAIAIQLLGELSTRWHPDAEPLRSLWIMLFTAGPVFGRVVAPYALMPWLSIMMFGWVLGRGLLVPQSRHHRARTCAAIGVGLLVVFAIVRGVNGYGNWLLYRESGDVLQWLHVAKYPASLAFTTLELGIAFLLLAGFLALDDPARPRRGLAVLSLFGSTAFFYYLLHAHLIYAAAATLDLDVDSYGLAKTWIAAALALIVLAAPCWWYRRYKAAHPHGWTRYI
jgi:uncharacterized membrane protein